MAVILKWTPEAEIAFFAVVDYLEKEWTKKKSKNLFKKQIELLRRFNKILECINQKASRGLGKLLSISKIACSTFFDETENVIFLLTFWDNRKNPANLKF